MKRMITKQMRDSFNLRFFIKHFSESGMKMDGVITMSFSECCAKRNEKQRILILRRTIK